MFLQTSEASGAAPLFAALGDETRLQIVSRLCAEGPLSITRLTEGTAITRQAVTKHLLALADAGIAADTQRGRERVWRLVPEGVDEARKYLDQISTSWDHAIERLRVFVDEE